MLQTIRDRSQGWIAWVIIIAIAITFALFGIEHYLTGAGSNDNVVTVNGEDITKVQLDRQYQRIRDYQQSLRGVDYNPNQAQVKQMRQEALNELIATSVLSQVAQKGGLGLSSDQLEYAVQQIAAFQAEGRFSRLLLQQFLVSQQYTMAEFYRDMKDALLIKQLQMGIVDSAFALPSEAVRLERLVDQKRQFSYVVFPWEKYKAGTPISDSDAKAYYEEHLSDYQSPETVSLSYVVLSMSDIAQQLDVPEQTVKKVYQDNIALYTSPERWKVSHILLRTTPGGQQDIEAVQKQAQEIAQKARAGEDFAQLAKDYSQDIASRNSGGEMPWLERDSALDKRFMAAVEKLDKVGEVAGPVQTTYGFEIIKLNELQKPIAKPFSDVKAQIRQNLVNQKAEEIFANDSDRLANISYENPSSLQAVADDLKLQVRTTSPLTREGGDTALTKNPKVIQAAFSSDVLAQGNNSDLIALNDHEAVVIRVAEHSLAQAKSFAVVKEQVTQAIVKEKAEQKTQQQADAFLASLTAGQSMKSLAQKARLEWHETELLGRRADIQDFDLLQEAFTLAHPTETVSAPSSVINLPNGDFAVVSLLKVEELPASQQEKDAEVLKNFKLELSRTFGISDYNLYTESKITDAKIKYEDKELEDSK